MYKGRGNIVAREVNADYHFASFNAMFIVYSAKFNAAV